MNVFCQAPSRKNFNKLSISEKNALYHVALSDIPKNQNLARRIIAYYEKKPLSLGVEVLNWRTTTRHGKYDYDIIPKATLLFRGSKSPIVLLKKATYFALEIANANQYLSVKKKSHLSMYKTKRSLKLFRLDSIHNINMLLSDLYTSNKTLYKIVYDMFMPVIIPLKPKLMAGIVHNHNDPISFKKLVRNSIMKNDFLFSNWLCAHGFHGYSAGIMDIYIHMTLRKSFPEEIMLCDPSTVLQLCKTIETPRLKTREQLQDILQNSCL